MTDDQDVPVVDYFEWSGALTAPAAGPVAGAQSAVHNPATQSSCPAATHDRDTATGGRGDSR